MAKHGMSLSLALALATPGCTTAGLLGDRPATGQAGSGAQRPNTVPSANPTPATLPSRAPGPERPGTQGAGSPLATPDTGAPVLGLDPKLAPPGPAPGAPTSVGPLAGATEGEGVVDLLNQTRALVGLPPVAWDPVLAEGAAKHAHYMILNFQNPLLEGLKVHEEDPSLPGATPEGAKAGKSANIGWGLPVDTTLAFITSLYHRGPVLSGSLEAVGLGFETNGKERDATVLMFRHASRPNPLVGYPAPGQTEVQLGFGGETPHPLPTEVRAGSVGYPITLVPPSGQTFSQGQGKLTDAAGQEVPCFYSDETRRAADFSQAGAICLFPQKRLLPGATYQVEISARLAGVPRTWRWAFTTQQPQAADAGDVASLASRVLHAVTLTGDVARATPQADGSLLLQLGTAPDAWVQVVVPAELKPQASAYTARRIRAMGVCVLRGRRAYEIEVARAEDLSVLDGALPMLDATDDAALHQAAGKLALVRGKVEHAGTLADGTVWLAFMPDKPVHTAFVPAAVWAETKLGDPTRLVGQILTVRAVVRSTRDHTTIELDVAQPDQISTQ